MAVRLAATTGRTTGSRPSTRLRGEGHVPAVLYGLGTEPVAVSVAWPELRRVLSTDAGMNALIDLDVDGDVNLTIVKDLQRHPVRRDVLHVDFLRLNPDVDILVDIPIHLTGEAEEVTRSHGIVEQAMHHLAIHVRPADIPDGLVADISTLTIGTTITVGDIELPAGARTEVAAEEAVATAYIPRRVAATLDADGLPVDEEGGAEGEGADSDGGDGGESGGADDESDADADS